MHDDEHVDPVLRRAIDDLQDRGPDRDLWPAIRDDYRAGRRSQLIVRWPVAIAAALALITTTAGGTAFWMARRAERAQVATTQVRGSGPAIVQADAGSSDDQVERAIAELETLLDANVTNIDTDTYRALARSLAILDQAIAAAADRERASPDDTSARRHYSASLRKKLDVLERVTSRTSIRASS